MSSPGKVHDPLFHFETHFPERLSRLPVGTEFNPSGSFKRSKKTRQRTGIRYKTQPVTFDEITEVDEEAVATIEDGSGSGGPVGDGKTGLMGQFQAFSRSMDGLLPKISPDHHQHAHAGFGRRHVERPPSIPSIPERVEFLGKGTSPTTTPTALFAAGGEERLQQTIQSETDESPGSPSTGQEQTTLAVQQEEGRGVSAPQPIPSPNIAPRRQKVTAKAKKRQKAAEEDNVSKESGT